VADGWQLRADYTYTHSEVTTSEVHGINEGDPLFGVPAHMLNARLRWQPTAAIDAILGGQYRSARHRPNSFHEPHLGGNAQGAAEALGDFHGYTLLNLDASYHLTQRIQLNGAIANLFDKNFVDYRPYPLRNNPQVTAFSHIYNNIPDTDVGGLNTYPLLDYVSSQSLRPGPASDDTSGENMS